MFHYAYTAWRHAAGHSHQSLSAALGVSRRTSEAFASGSRIPTPDVLATLARLGFVCPPLPPRRGPGRPMNAAICDLCDDEVRPLDEHGVCKPCRDWERAQGWHQEGSHA